MFWMLNIAALFPGYLLGIEIGRAISHRDWLKRAWPWLVALPAGAATIWMATAFFELNAKSGYDTFLGALLYLIAAFGGVMDFRGRLSKKVQPRRRTK